MAIASKDTVKKADEAPVVEALPVDEASARVRSAEKIVQDHVLLATAAGFVPAPGIDLAAGFAVQAALLGRLSKLYGVSYSENVGKGVVMSLASSLGGLGAGMIGSSVIKLLPVVGTVAGTLGLPVAMGAFTYALGKVFIAHFESGGTFIDFNPKAYGEYFRTMFKRGKTVASDVSDEAKAEAKPSKAPATTAAPAPAA